MGDKTRGIYDKFIVKRTDGTDHEGSPRTSPGKHFGCEYFVLDITHDPHAIPALAAYADSAERDGYGLLAADLREQYDLHRAVKITVTETEAAE